MAARDLTVQKTTPPERLGRLRDISFSLKLIQWLLPLVLFLTATVYELIEHGIKRTEPFALSLTAEIVFFGIGGPVAVVIIFGYLRALVASETAAGQSLERLNRELEAKVAERTALLAERNAELARANQQLQQVDALKSEFVSLVSHELRAPLTALNGGLEVALQTADTLPAPARRILEAMVNESRRLTQLVQNILDVSRLEAGRLTLNLGPVAVAPILHRSVEVILGARRPVTWQMPAQIPPVWADEVYYEQIIRNLLRNADKYSSAGVPIEVNVQVLENEISVEVVDHGAGITPEVQAVMFERFQRGQTGENAPPGWGLGLYFARKLTEAQAGRLTVRSPAWPTPTAPGAAFAVSFPAAAEAPEETEDG